MSKIEYSKNRENALRFIYNSKNGNISTFLSTYDEIFLKEFMNLGFIEIDKTTDTYHITRLGKDYIEELQECIFQCIDSRKLDMTEIKRDELEESLKTVNVEMYSSLEKMFTNLANLKKLMLLKREAKLKYIDDTVKNSATNIIMMIKTRILNNMFDSSSQLQHRETSENDNMDL